jgi:hypothetical protein
MTSATTRSALWSVVAVAALLFAACGDDSTSNAGASDPAASEVASDDSAQSGDAETPSIDVDADVDEIVEGAEEMLDAMVDDDGGVGIVTIGAETWEFTLFPEHVIASCDADFFGGFFALLTSTDDIMEPGDTLALTLPGGDFTEPPQVTLNIQTGGEAEWIADETYYERSPDLPPGIGVTNFSIDGNTASGTATFFEEESWHQSRAGDASLLQIAEGTFEVTCG